MQKETIFQKLQRSIESLQIGDSEKQKLRDGINRLKNQKTNLLITGATGSGKSSTINALFGTDTAKVGMGVDPETMDIQKYELDNLVLWDSPGLGDGKEKDQRHAKGIIKKLNELDKDGRPLIDLVLVILDGGSRDLGTSYELINQVIIPNLGEHAQERIIVAINQADIAMKGQHWDHETNQPKPKLISFLDEKVRSVKERIKEATGVDVDPIYYCAGYKEDDEQQKPWNLSKLLFLIVNSTPLEKRLPYMDNISADQEMWKDDDGLKDYKKEVQRSFQEVASHVAKNVVAGAAAGAALGSVVPVIGTAIGAAVGGAVGFFAGLLGF